MEQLMVLNLAILKTAIKETLLEVLQEVKSKSVSERDMAHLCAREAAAFLNIKMSTLYEKTSSQVIPHFKQGNRLYFDLKALKAWRHKGRVQTVDELSDEAITYTLRNPNQAV